jgi:hypothetical protein
VREKEILRETDCQKSMILPKRILPNFKTVKNLLQRPTSKSEVWIIILYCIYTFIILYSLLSIFIFFKLMFFINEIVE